MAWERRRGWTDACNMFKVTGLALGALLQVCKLTALRSCAHSEHWRRGEDVLQAPLEDVQPLLHLSGGDVERRQEADGLARACGCRVWTAGEQQPQQHSSSSCSRSGGSGLGSSSTLNAPHLNCSSLQTNIGSDAHLKGDPHLPP